MQVYRVVYDDDDEDEDIDEEGIKEHLRSHEYAFGKIVDSIVPEFDYLENRLTVNCKTMLSCSSTL